MQKRHTINKMGVAFFRRTIFEAYDVSRLLN